MGIPTAEAPWTKLGRLFHLADLVRDLGAHVNLFARRSDQLDAKLDRIVKEQAAQGVQLNAIGLGVGKALDRCVDAARDAAREEWVQAENRLLATHETQRAEILHAARETARCEIAEREQARQVAAKAEKARPVKRARGRR